MITIFCDTIGRALLHAKCGAAGSLRARIYDTVHAHEDAAGVGELGLAGTGDRLLQLMRDA